MKSKLFKSAQVVLTTIISIILVYALALTFAIPAYADNGNSGTGGGGTTGNNSSFLYWDHFSADGTWDSMNLPNRYLSVSVPAANGDYGNAAFNRSWYGSDTYWAACVRHSGNGDGFVSQKADTLSVNGNWKSSSRLSTFFTCYEHQQYLPDGAGFYEVAGSAGYTNGNIFKLNRNGQVMSAIWLDSSKMYIPFTFSNKRTKVVTFNNPDEPEEHFSHVSETPEWKYHNAPTSGTYHGITPPTGTEAYNYSNTITVTVEDEIKTITIVCLAKDAPSSFEEAEAIVANPTSQYTVKGDPVVTYDSTNLRDMTREITYKAEIPESVQTKYRPFNVNRQSYSELGDNGITSDYINGVKNLEGSVSNDQGISDNSTMNALDINNDTSFDVHFNENLGMNSEYDWVTAPEPLANGTWEYTNGSYANGRVGDLTNITDGGTGIYRFNLEQNQSITGSMTVDGVTTPLASLTLNDNEKLSNEYFNKKIPFNGGQYQARFVMTGTYTLDNEKESTYPLYWLNTYTQSRFFEYGVEYEGTYDTSSISQASLVAPLASPTASYSDSHFTTNGLNQRGLYVGCNQQTFNQPVVTATWNVKTIAGDTRY